MRRDCPVWIEAYQQYLIGKYKKEDIPSFDSLSDDEISNLFFQYVQENGIEEEAVKWVHEYCRHWM
ncbi:MAG: hypothetical protein NC247_06240 [Ruminococcus flavefaciens]|nr:hypothetical protein [Ruminococcus flavefaciens]MCM1361890.1 hypothetical protein [Clostridiales bacterium]MCM1436036.1 hypothetical protein [Ruminococcus flavefaciens]